VHVWDAAGEWVSFTTKTMCWHDSRRRHRTTTSISGNVGVSVLPATLPVNSPRGRSLASWTWAGPPGQCK